MYMYDCVEHVACASLVDRCRMYQPGGCASLVDVHGVEHIKHKSMFV